MNCNVIADFSNKLLNCYFQKKQFKFSLNINPSKKKYTVTGMWKQLTAVCKKMCSNIIPLMLAAVETSKNVSVCEENAATESSPSRYVF